jgi:wyosine [tRNA(Phe)-imidazoG37] synthetase (radical SAM superfamily)
LSGEVDYITFVPNGEQTLDVNLGKTAEMLKDFDRIAIITHSLLIR